MSIEIKTSGIEPVRQTFSYIARRFGNKPATRYQEATYDVQSETNFHYIPQWNPDKTLNDKTHTKIEMEDWYAFRDPRQFYYGAYVQKRARMQENAEHNYSFFEKRQLISHIDEATQQSLTHYLIPLRHIEQTANLNFLSGSAYGYGTTLTQACLYAGMDRMGTAQYLSRIGLIVDGNSGDALTDAKMQWMDNPVWQGARALCEELLVQPDYFELLFAQGLLVDTYIATVYGSQYDQWLNEKSARDVSMLTEFMQETLKEQAGWADSIFKTAAAESEKNKTQLAAWLAKWQSKVDTAFEPVVSNIYKDQADDVQAAIQTALAKRLKKIGLA